VAKIEEILAKYSRKSDLIDVLEDIQEEFGYVSEDHMRKIEQTLRIPLVDITGVVTFYSAFKLRPSGRNIIQICRGTACHVKKSGVLLEYLEEKLGVKPSETTKDGRFTLECVNCIGACAKAPAMMIGGKVFGELTKEKIEKILLEFK
jgi:NADH-quinone oxidoreductase subunit E